MPRSPRTKRVPTGEARSYLAKAEEFAAAARRSLNDEMCIAATSMAVHAGINAGDAICVARLAQRAAGQEHDQARVLLDQAGTEGKVAAKHLARLLPLKNRAEDPARRRSRRARAASARGSQHGDLGRRVEAVLDQPADRQQASQRPPRADHVEVDVGAVAGDDVAKALLVSEREDGEVEQRVALACAGLRRSRALPSHRRDDVWHRDHEIEWVRG